MNMNVLTKIRYQNYNLNYKAKFLEILHKSFEIYLKTSARNNEKLKVFHGFITTAIYNDFDAFIKKVAHFILSI